MQRQWLSRSSGAAGEREPSSDSPARKRTPQIVAVLACTCFSAACTSDAVAPESTSPLVVTKAGQHDDMMALLMSGLQIDDAGCSFLNDGSSSEPGMLAIWPHGTRIDLRSGTVTMPYSTVAVEAGQLYLFTGGGIDVDSPLIASDLGTAAAGCLEKAAKPGLGAFLVVSVEPCTDATCPEAS